MKFYKENNKNSSIKIIEYNIQQVTFDKLDNLEKSDYEKISKYFGKDQKLYYHLINKNYNEINDKYIPYIDKLLKQKNPKILEIFDNEYGKDQMNEFRLDNSNLKHIKPFYYNFCIGEIFDDFPSKNCFYVKNIKYNLKETDQILINLGEKPKLFHIQKIDKVDNHIIPNKHSLYVVQDTKKTIIYFSLSDADKLKFISYNTPVFAYRRIESNKNEHKNKKQKLTNGC